MSNLNSLLHNFNFATVMNACVMKLNSSIKYGTATTNPEHIISPNAMESVCFLDTLKISNIVEKGPNKEFKAGINNFPVLRHGKAITMDITDALGKIETLQNFFGFKQLADSLYSSNSFADPLAILGKVKILNTQQIDQDLWIFIPCFVPKGVVTITQDSEGEFGVFDLGGTLYPVFCQYNTEGVHKEFYSFHSTEPNGDINATQEAIIYSELSDAIEAIRVGDKVNIFDSTQIVSSEN